MHYQLWRRYLIKNKNHSLTFGESFVVVLDLLVLTQLTSFYLHQMLVSVIPILLPTFFLLLIIRSTKAAAATVFRCDIIITTLQIAEQTKPNFLDQQSRLFPHEFLQSVLYQKDTIIFSRNPSEVNSFFYHIFNYYYLICTCGLLW